jgi:hypothetical protein
MIEIMISHLDRILQMRKQHEYGKRKDDGTYAFPLQLHQISREAVSALFYDDPEMEVTSDTWLEQTGSFIQQIWNNLEASKLSSEVVSITPTNDPTQSLAFVVQYDKAIEIQNAVVTYILSLSDAFEDTKSH